MYCVVVCLLFVFFFFFFFNDTATTEIYTLSLHDALPISASAVPKAPAPTTAIRSLLLMPSLLACQDRKSTRLNSSHLVISYAVFCLKKKKKKKLHNIFLKNKKNSKT